MARRGRDRDGGRAGRRGARDRAVVRRARGVGELWKEPGQTEERVKEIRHAEAQAAADALGASFRSFDLGDYPLVLDAAAVDTLTDVLRELGPGSS